MTSNPSTASDLAPPVVRTFADHIRLTLNLAWPVIISRSGMMIMVSTDVAMTGHAGRDELAFLGIAMTTQVTLMLVGIGMLFGTMVLTAQAHGAGEHERCGGIWRLGLVHALGYGIFFGLLCILGEEFLLLIGQTPEIAAGGGAVMIHYGWSMPAIMMMVVTSFFLEGISKPRPAMVITLFAILLNAGLNQALIYGSYGAPALGAEGAVIATSIVRWGMLLALLIYIFTMRDSVEFGVRGGRIASWQMGKTMRRIGYPVGFAQGIEASAFSTLVLMAGFMGVAPLAGFQIAMNLIALAFMTAIGFGVATSVRVGNAIGRNDQQGIAKAAQVGVGLAVVVMLFIGVGFLLFPQEIARIYTSDPEVINLAGITIMVAASLLVFDAAQCVLMSALRSCGEVWVPVILHGLSFWALALPFAAWLGFTQGLGIPGLMAGMLLGVVSASILLGLRLRKITRRPIYRL